LTELLSFVSKPYFTEENVASERSVIEQEIAMYDDSPSTALYYLAVRAMYRDHPIKTSICGSRSSIERLDAKRLYEVYSAFYHPSRWRIFVAGRFDPDQTEKAVEAFLPSIAPPPLVRCTDFSNEPLLPLKNRVDRRMRLHLPLFALGLKYEMPCGDPKKISREAIARDLMISALLGKSGSLYESLYDRGLVTAPLASTVETLPSAAYLLITGESENPDLVLDEVTAALADAAEGRVSEIDFERMKRVAYSDFLASLDSTEELAEGFCSSVTDGLDLFTYGRLLSELDFDFAKELFRRDFDPARLVRARLLPKR
jgi:predicted Zn-dependent peptidase